MLIAVNYMLIVNNDHDWFDANNDVYPIVGAFPDSSGSSLVKACTTIDRNAGIEDKLTTVMTGHHAITSQHTGPWAITNYCLVETVKELAVLKHQHLQLSFTTIIMHRTPILASYS